MSVSAVLRIVLYLTVVGSGVFLMFLLCRRFKPFRDIEVEYPFFCGLLLFLVPLLPVWLKADVYNESLLQSFKADITPLLENPFICRIWLLGAAASFSRLWITQVWVSHKINPALQPAPDDAQRIFEAIYDELGLRASIALAVVPGIRSPVGTGLIRKTVILPEDFLHRDPFDLELALRHELVHFLYRDHWVKLAMGIIAAIHWFNPCIYLLRHAVNEACELRCDKRTVRGLSLGERRYYCLMLLSLPKPPEELVQTDKLLSPAFSNGFMRNRSFNQLKKRIVRIKAADEGKRRGRIAKRLALAAAASMILLLSAFTYGFAREIWQYVDAGADVVNADVVYSADYGSIARARAKEEFFNISDLEMGLTISAHSEEIQLSGMAISSESGAILMRVDTPISEDTELTIYFYAAENPDCLLQEMRLHEGTQKIVLSDTGTAYAYIGIQVKHAPEDIEQIQIILLDTEY